MLTHKELVKRMLSEAAVKAAYDDQAEEFALLDGLLSARQHTSLTPAKTAKKMEMKIPSKRGRS